MKKIITAGVIFCAMTLLSANVLAGKVNQDPAVIGTDLCVQPQDWQITQRFPTVVLTCAAKNVQCSLVDLSGGIVNDNFWELIDWAFTKSNGAQVTNQCTAYPMNPNCDFNTPRYTCASLYLTHMTA